MTNKSCIVLGLGPSTGASVARRFAREGYAVAVAARRLEVLEPVVAEIEAAGGRALAIPTDATDEQAVVGLVRQTEKDLGPLGVAVYNASGRVKGSILDLKTDEVINAWKVSCLGGLLLGREAAKCMVPRKEGTIVFTGATSGMRGSAEFAGFAIGKFGLRALAQSMARELGPKGIHVAYVNIDGQIHTPRQAHLAAERPPDAMLDPEAIAETYFQLHSQHRSAWTQELDIRPWVEKF
ncbi:MAG: SDR family NAD(P)-dependent oxidoreductase [Alphaproteobacteria bacterium]|jgi:NAD(P)-dependent dehydrogenase (short-subunit alcohol dehydrogenase family)